MSVPGAYNTYIRLKIGNKVFDYDNTENMMSLDVVRRVNDCCLEFVAEIYDYTAFDVESVILAAKDRNIILEYGYAEDSGRRSPKWSGFIAKVSPTFDTNGETLTIEGMAYPEYTSLMNGIQKTYHGTPAEVFQAVARDENWQVMECVDTQQFEGDIYHPQVQVWSTSKKADQSSKQFIDEEVIPYAVTTDGTKGTFELVLLPYEDRTEAYFRPRESEVYQGSGDYDIEYSYTVGEPSNEIISFHPNYTYLSALMGASGVTVTAKDSKTGEDIYASVSATSEGIQLDYQGTEGLAGTEIIGNTVAGNVTTGFTEVASKEATLEAIIIEARNKFEAAYNMTFTADLVVMGDPNILPGKYMKLVVITQ